MSSPRLLTCVGADPLSSLYGGLAQQEPVDPRGVMSRLRRLAKKDDQVIYPGQYDNEHVRAHERTFNGIFPLTILELEISCALDGIPDIQTAP